MKLTIPFARTLLLSAIMVTSFAIFTLSARVQAPDQIRIDVQVMLKQDRVVFNMDHTAFSRDTPVGLAHMTMMLDRFKRIGTEWKLVAFFHGDAGYMLLNDEVYNTLRKTKTGKPCKGMIENLIKQSAQIEECAVTMWG